MDMLSGGTYTVFYGNQEIQPHEEAAKKLDNMLEVSLTEQRTGSPYKAVNKTTYKDLHQHHRFEGQHHLPASDCS
jgi:hypothetical protein